MSSTRGGHLALSLIAALFATALAAPAASASEPIPHADGTLSAAQAAAAGQTETAEISYTDGIEALPALAGVVTGSLIVGLADGTYQAAGSSSFVRFWRWDAAQQLWFLVHEVTAFGPNGEFSIDGLEAGDYRVEFVSYDDWPVREYWNDQYTWIASDVITLMDGIGLDLGVVALDPTDIAFDRISGANRYQTAVEISKAVIPQGASAPVVYLVNGLGYADALTAGPAAAKEGGVMLLTDPVSLPTVVAAELDRLNPGRVVIVGGPSLVSSAIEQAVQAYTPTPGDVDRISGANRYETSRLLVSDAFASGVPDLFIATGRNFPDALAAGPAASRLGGAVLLVDGAVSSTDTATRSLISSLGTPDLHLAGGTGVVSAGVEASLAGHVGASATVTRYAGDNRYDTAAAINFSIFDDLGTDFVFIAGGAGFADALAGGPLAAAYDAPLYLAPQSCLRSQDYVDMVLLLTQFAYGLGGTGVLSDRVLSGEFC